MRDGDNDVAAALPKAPMPSPARRTAAIDEAMRRFDGIEATSSTGQQQQPKPPRGSWWATLSRPQFAGLVSASLIAVIAMPVAWVAIDRTSSPNMKEAVPVNTGDARQGTTRMPVESAMPAQPAPLAVQPAPPAPPASSPALAPTDGRQSGDTRPVDSNIAKDAVVVTGTQIRGVAPTGAKLTTTAGDDIPAAARSSVGQSPTTIPGFSNFNGSPDNSGAAAKRGTPGSLAAAKAVPPPPPPPPPRTPAPIAQVESGAVGGVDFVTRRAPSAAGREAEGADAEASRDMVVTGTASRGRGAARAARGDWNACTVNDPGRNLGRCRSLVNPGAAGTAGRAAAHVADGLTRAWQGDFDGATAAFDAAIALSPRLAFAYLNRGLAWQHQGELDRAIADLNQGVRYAPNDARGYYNRSVILRQRGDARRAAADEERAVEIDSRYEALFK